MAMLAMVVNNLPEPRRISPAIRDLAVRHVEYGVKLADYDALGEALLWTLEQVLGEDLSPSVREAWAVCYDELAGEMKQAATSDYDLPALSEIAPRSAPRRNATPKAPATASLVSVSGEHQFSGRPIRRNRPSCDTSRFL
jgi:hypothetical protein